jgi:hypothetical protein
MTDILEAQAHNIAFLGVVPKPIKADGNVFDPLPFIVHDIDHAINWLNALGDKDNFTADHSPADIHDKMLKLVRVLRSLPENERSAATLFAFAVFHEYPVIGINILSRNLSKIPLMNQQHLKSIAETVADRLADERDFGQDFPDLMTKSFETREQFVLGGYRSLEAILQHLP